MYLYAHETPRVKQKKVSRSRHEISRKDYILPRKRAKSYPPGDLSRHRRDFSRRIDSLFFLSCLFVLFRLPCVLSSSTPGWANRLSFCLPTNFSANPFIHAKPHYKRPLNSSMVMPASLIIPAIVNALMGFEHGMVIILSPLVIVICFLCLVTQNPRFSKAFTAL